MKIEPLVSIIIINWNGGEVFKNCLESLRRIDYPNWELIVVDNGSSDGSENYPSHGRKIIQFKLIRNSVNLGFAEANNQGYKIANGKYILLLNNDTKVEKDFLSKLVKRIEQDKLLAVVQPKIRLLDRPEYLDNAGSFITKIGFLHHWGFMQKDGSEFDQEREVFSAKGACMLIRKVVIDKVGLFDRDFISYFEESDFCWRVWLSGYRVLFYPQAEIYHKLGFTIKRLDVVKINYHYYKNRICALIKNLDTKNILFLLFPHLFISLGIMVVFLIRFKPNNALIIIKALNWNLWSLPNTLKKRRIVQASRVINDDQLFKNLSMGINWVKYWQDFKRIEKDSVG